MGGMNSPASSFPSPLRNPLVLGGTFAFWSLLLLLLYTVGGNSLSVDGVEVPICSLAWLAHAARFVLPFWLGTLVVLHTAPRLIGRPAVAFWRGAALLVVALSAAHAIGHDLLTPSQPFTWSWLTASSLVWGFHYAGILGVVLVLHQRRDAEARRRDLLTTQLRALRAQLQPHFLFNTLQAIGTTARHDGATAARMTALLGDLLRQTLREREGGLVTLAEEHEQLQPYLQLQRLRFADRLQIAVDLPTALLGARLPDLLLQPLVENALQHGIEQRPGPGTIHVRARRDGDALVLEVQDDGTGPTVSGDDLQLGTGLGATRQRLQVLYGDRASVDLRPNEHGGTTATLRLPFHEVVDAA